MWMRADAGWRRLAETLGGGLGGAPGGWPLSSPGLDFEDDSPAVDVNIIDDDESGQVTGRGFLSVLSEVVDKTWREGRDDLGYPYLRLIAKSDIGQRDPAAV